jgi:hypothetical protein
VVFFFIFLFFWRNPGLNSELCTCKAGILLLELYLQSSPFCSGYLGDEVLQTICLGWTWTANLLISASQVAGITGINHWHLALNMQDCCWTVSSEMLPFQSAGSVLQTATCISALPSTNSGVTRTSGFRIWWFSRLTGLRKALYLWIKCYYEEYNLGVTKGKSCLGQGMG